MKKNAYYLLAALPVLFLAMSSCRSSRPVGRYPEPDRRVVIIDRNDDHRGRGHQEHGRGYGYGHRKHGHNREVVVVRVRRPLIVIRTPDIIIGRYNDGRYYYRNPDGFMYWEGNDRRFYLDEQYLGRVEYNDNEYNEWRNRGNRNYSGNNDRRNNNNGYSKPDEKRGRGNGHGNGKKKGHGKHG